MVSKIPLAKKQVTPVIAASRRLGAKEHASEVSGRYVRSSAFTRQRVVNVPNRLKAELQTGQYAEICPAWFELHAQSGGERAAVQTLREVW